MVSFQDFTHISFHKSGITRRFKLQQRICLDSQEATVSHWNISAIRKITAESML